MKRCCMSIYFDNYNILFLVIILLILLLLYPFTYTILSFLYLIMLHILDPQISILTNFFRYLFNSIKIINCNLQYVIQYIGTHIQNVCVRKHRIYVYIHKYILIYIFKKIEETNRKNRIRILKHKNWFHVITQELS